MNFKKFYPSFYCDFNLQFNRLDVETISQTNSILTGISKSNSITELLDWGEIMNIFFETCFSKEPNENTVGYYLFTVIDIIVFRNTENI